MPTELEPEKAASPEDIPRTVPQVRRAGRVRRPSAAVLYCGDLAVTSTELVDGRVTAEVARRQPDGSWRWIIDQPDV